MLHDDVEGNLVGRSVVTLTQSADGAVTAVAIAVAVTEIARRKEAPTREPCACNRRASWYSTCPDDQISNARGGGSVRAEAIGANGPDRAYVVLL